jgi:TPP-dependent pyruvate/acetoin dehydrogenase alpha subunit
MWETRRSTCRRRSARNGANAMPLEWGYLTAAEDERMAADVQAELQAAIEFAKSSPLPAPETALEDVYAGFDYLGRPLPGVHNG